MRLIGSRALAAVLLLCLSGSANDSRPVGRTAAQFPTFGVALAPPDGWTEIPRDKFKTVVQWVSPDSTPEDRRALIMVEGGKPSDADARTAAAQMAKDWGGSVAPTQTTLAGEPAWRITADAEGDKLRPIEGIIAYHGGHVYMIMGGVTPGHSCHEQIESVRKSWKWVPVESCAKHLAPRPEPFPAFNGAVQMSFPEMMHTNPTDTPDRVLDLEMSDLRGADRSEFLLFAQLIPLPPGQNFRAVKDGFLPQMQQRMKFAGELKWHDAKGPTERVASQSVRLEDQNQGDHPLYAKFSLIHLDGQRVVLIDFTTGTKDAKELDAFDAAAEQVVKSVTLAQMPPAGRSAPK